MAYNSSIGTEQEQQSVIGDAGLVSASNGVLITTSETTSVAVEASVDSLFQWTTIAESSTFGLIWLTAVIGNGLITCTLLRRGLLTHPSNRLVFSVTLSNLIFSFCVFPCILVSSIKQQWIFGSVWCYINAFFTILVTVASSATLAAIALDRYFAIVRPMQYSRKMTRNRANGLLIFAWCLGLVCALPPLFGWSTYDYEESHRACFLGWTSSLSYSIVLLIITFCFPLVSMLVFYYAILQVARTKCKRINFGTMSEPPMTPLERIQTLAAAGNPPPTPPGCAELANMLGELGRVAMSDSQTSIGNNNNNNRSLRRNRFSFNGRKPSFSWLSSTSSINSTAPVKGMRTIFLVLAAFLLTWLPMLVLALLDMIRYLGGLGAWTPPQWLYVFAMWSMCAGSVTYPILYGIYNRAIRKELRLCLSCSGGLNTKKWRNVNHFYHHGGSTGAGQRRGSKWSNYSEYAALRPRETSAAATAAVSAAVAAAAAASTAQQGLTESLTALQAGMSDIKSIRVRKSSQDSGAVIPSDDEDGTGHARSSSHASGHSSQSHHRVEHKLLASNAPHAVPSTAAAAVATWRAFNRPRMALAVLAVSLQHIAAHSDHLQYHRQQQEIEAKMNGATIRPVEEDEEKQPEEGQQQVDVPLQPAVPVLPVADDVRTSSLDEGIEPDR
ncbi:G-protein coupled receptor 161-like [Daphnia carinata]|uniref:G-protein coupled receptor 161-like n=1 Tax=Daphnia carinata TaxID=120202 RepID=UPI0025797CC9|nr:G-protein coupled receptor 161-like [Daphnia carinata]